MKKILTVTLLLCSVMLVAVACNSETESTSASSQTAQVEDITVQLSWINEYSVTQLHNAVENGHFAENGLNVSITEGGFSEDGVIDPIAEVVDGNAQFGTSNATSLIQARQAGFPVVAIMTTLHRNPDVIISLEDAGIARPQDMIGKTVAVAAGGSDTLFNSLLASQEIDPDAIDIVPRTSFGIDPLVNGEVDAIAGWIINEAVMVEEAGLTGNTIVLSDYAIDTYGSVIFTTEELIENDPDMVQNFVDSVIAGMQDILDDTEGSIDNTLTFNDELDRDAQLRRLNAMIPLMNVPGQNLGDMQAEIWALTHEIMLENDILAEEADWESAFTTQFVSDSAE